MGWSYFEHQNYTCKSNLLCHCNSQDCGWWCSRSVLTIMDCRYLSNCKFVPLFSTQNFGKHIRLVFGLYFASFFVHALNSNPTTNLYIFKWAVFVTPELRYWYILFFHEIESIYSWIIICNLKIYAHWNPSRNALDLRNRYRIMKFRYKNKKYS